MDSLQRIISVARMYYEKGMKQEEIARRMKVSRTSVSLALAEARQKGIVEITIRNPLEDDTRLSQTLAERFALKQCVVVPTAIRDSDVLIDLISSRAVEVFDREVQSGDCVGIAWGRTCYAFMSGYRGHRSPRGTRVVPLVGGSNRNLARFQMNEIVRLFAEKLHGTPTFIHAPVLPSSLEDYRRYMGSSEMRTVSEMWRSLDIAVVSVGPPPVTRDFDGFPTRTRWRATADPETLPVGDICARRFDVRGRFIDEGPGARVIGIPIASLRQAKKILCIAGGLERTYSLLGALKTGLITNLVTDEQTAAAVLEAVREDEAGVIGRSIRSLFRRRG